MLISFGCPGDRAKKFQKIVVSILILAVTQVFLGYYRLVIAMSRQEKTDRIKYLVEQDVEQYIKESSKKEGLFRSVFVTWPATIGCLVCFYLVTVYIVSEDFRGFFNNFVTGLKNRLEF